MSCRNKTEVVLADPLTSGLAPDDLDDEEDEEEEDDSESEADIFRAEANLQRSSAKFHNSVEVIGYDEG